MSETEDYQRRFQAAVDVIQSLPKNGSYRPSYEVMLRFYGLYKQAVYGPCTTSRPGFWDPVGRYKWEAWNHLGSMSRESAMATYVDEIKKVAQEVIDTMQINEKTLSFFHYFEPLYHVIHDMPRPPEALFSLSSGENAKEPIDGLAEHEVKRAAQKLALQQDSVVIPYSEVQPESTEPPMSECQGPISDSENEVFCDSMEQLDTSKVTQMGAGLGGEGAEDKNGPPMRRRAPGREGVPQGWRHPSGDGFMAHRNTRWVQQFTSGAGSTGGGGHSDGGHNRQQDGQVQQQIILALRQLKEDMQSAMERLDVVEGLATANAQNSQWRSHIQLTAEETEEKCWPFEISGRTLLLLLVWPFVTQGLMILLRQRMRKIHGYK